LGKGKSDGGGRGGRRNGIGTDEIYRKGGKAMINLFGEILFFAFIAAYKKITGKNLNFSGNVNKFRA
jgi:hypothetical protein